MGLNSAQNEAVAHHDGPCMVLAGPGSGKTLTIAKRIEYLIQKHKVRPEEILVITFTKYASNEMKKRFLSVMGEQLPVTFGTFHGIYYGILKWACGIGQDNLLTDEERYQLLRQVIAESDKDGIRTEEEEKDYLKDLSTEIGRIKNDRLDIQTYESARFGKERFRTMYCDYEAAKKRWNKIDFEDMLLLCCQLFLKRPDILEKWQQKFRYILVDEFQDINQVQYDVVRMLAAPEDNLFVVGDDDQSIYKFRGANIKNILNFEQVYEDAKVIKLEQNYRSTSNILNAANAVIRNNCGRKDKTLWTDNGDGEKIHFRQFDSAYDEAEYIVGDIREHVDDGSCTYNDNAILYRTNAQSRMFEEKFVTANIPYKVVGGVNFYARREIKDLLSYLKTVDNGQDDLAVRRIVNVPKRGIGLTSINRVQEYASTHEIGFYEALRAVDLIPNIGRGASRLDSFVALIEHFKADALDMSILDLMQEIMDETGYIESLQAEDSIEAETRIENIDELMSKIAAYEEACEEANEPATLSGFLEEVALVADIDSLDESSDYVVLMTLHSAKGLEFPKVYLAGLEDGIFPSYMTITSDDPLEIEEERRLCYVGITRAKQRLTLTSAKSRMIRGETQYNKVSRFIREIPRELVAVGGQVKDKVEDIPKPTNYAQAKTAFKTKIFDPKQFQVKKADTLDYGIGDQVKHIKFGVGTVEGIVEGGKDYEVTVNFEKAGVKKMFAAFAKLKKV